MRHNERMDTLELPPLLIIGFKASCYFKQDGSNMSKTYAVACPLAHAEDVLKTPLGLASRCLDRPSHFAPSEARETMVNALRPYLGFQRDENASRSESFDPMGMVRYGSFEDKPKESSLSVCLSFTQFSLRSPGSLNPEEFDSAMALALKSATRMRDDLGERHAVLIDWPDHLDYRPFAFLAHECCESLSQARDIQRSIQETCDRAAPKSKSI